MKYETAIGYYRKAHALAHALGVSTQAVYRWKRLGVIPFRKAIELQEQTRGRIEIDFNCYARRTAPRPGNPSA